MSHQQSFSYIGTGLPGLILVTSTKLGQMCLAKGPQHSDAGEASYLTEHCSIELTGNVIHLCSTQCALL